jgi:hypothetical protein
MMDDIVSITIRDAAAMTEGGRETIAAWLRAEAALILKDGARYAPGYFSRYLAPEGELSEWKGEPDREYFSAEK